MASRDCNLVEIGFKNINYTDNKMTVKSAEHNPIKGFILTRSMEPYGRPVSFVF